MLRRRESARGSGKEGNEVGVHPALRGAAQDVGKSTGSRSGTASASGSGSGSPVFELDDTSPTHSSLDDVYEEDVVVQVPPPPEVHIGLCIKTDIEEKPAVGRRNPLRLSFIGGGDRL